MKTKRIVCVALILVTILILSGCSQNQQQVFNAYLKMQNVSSAHEHIILSLKMNGSDFDPATQQKVDQAAAYLNNAKLDLDIRTSGNSEQTVNQSQIMMDVALPGLEIKVPCWVDMDLTQSTPKLSEVIQIPQLATSYLPKKFAGKEYMVINPFDQAGIGMGAADLTDFAKFIKDFKTKEVSFLTGYAARFNPDIDLADKGLQSVQTDDGLKQAQVYELNLNDV